ncbi:alpha/beta hydrolase [Robertmurraya beringensis]|uniref:Alpha/beta hydrolase n=1 Tax=Robertmurraya beringensis TaxID=641660 RepID=A0ABV6KKY5_9BACI|nr:lysophospholipase [Mycobacteroides abscessus subsp. abscessus]
MWKWEAEGTARAVIVIVHGAMEHHRRYGWLIEQWRNSGFHVVMGDLPGHGLTTRSRRGHIDSFEEYVNEVKKWIDASYQFDLPVFLIGHSMGGLITLRLLQKERLNVAGVILSSPCLGLVNKPSPILHAATFILNKVFPALRVSSGITFDMVTRNEDVRELDLKDTLYVKKVSVRWYRELEEAMKNAFAMIKRTQDTPLLVVQSGDDRIVDKEKVRTWFNSVPLSEKRFKEWPKCYHEVFNEPEREEVFLYVKDFVEGQLKGLGYIV